MIDLIEMYLKLFKDALSALYREEADVVAVNANERCMAAHVFAYMKKEMAKNDLLNQYKIDYEYNREGLVGASKELCCKFRRDKKKKNHYVIPDLIIHKRGDIDNGTNILLVEFKKPDVAVRDDIAKLIKMTKQNGKFKYKVGLLIIFGRSLPETVFRLYIDGACRRCVFTGNQYASLRETMRKRLKELSPHPNVSVVN